MNWDAIGAIAELAGALAVVITLIYLSVQMRQNSKLLSASLSSMNRDASNQITGLLSSDRVALRVFWAGLAGRNKLEELDRQQFDALMSLYFEALTQNHEQDYHVFEGREQWLFAKPGVQEWWLEYRLNYNDIEFQSYIDASVAALSDSAD